MDTTVFALSAGPRPEATKDWAGSASFPFGPASFSSFSCLKIFKDEFRAGKFWNLNAKLIPVDRVRAHLHYIRDLGPSIRVRARMQSKQVNWCFVFTLIWVHVRDFCLGRPCPNSSLHVAIFLDTDVRVRPRLWNAHAQSHLFRWSLSNLVQNGRDLRSEPRI